MKLQEVQTREQVPTGAVGSYTNRLDADRGWALSFDAGIVEAKNDRITLLIPVSNVAYLRPTVVQAKPGPKAA